MHRRGRRDSHSPMAGCRRRGLPPPPRQSSLLWFCVPASIVPARGHFGWPRTPARICDQPKPPVVFRFDRNRDCFENRRFAMRYLSFIGALAIVAAVAAAVYFFGGYSNVAATQPDPDIVAWALQKVRT